MSLNYSEINARAINLLLSVKKHACSLDQGLKALVELRVSQINGCAYCVDLHSNEAREAGEPQRKLDCLPAWEESDLFTDREMAALSWAESVTNIAGSSAMGERLEVLLGHYSESEAVDLTIIIALMNCMNRLAISFGDKPQHRST